MAEDLRRNKWIINPDGSLLDKSPDEVARALQRNLRVGADGKIGNSTLNAYIAKKRSLAGSNPQSQSELTAKRLADEANASIGSRRLTPDVWIDMIRYAMNNLGANYRMAGVFEGPYGFVIPPMDRALPTRRPSLCWRRRRQVCRATKRRPWRYRWRW